MAVENSAQKPQDPRLGTVLGARYRLRAPLGAGAMGAVYEGEQEGLGRRVAVKCLHPHLGTSSDFVTRFMIEARVASRLSHPNVVRIFDFGSHPTPEGPLLYLVMELCSGESLGSLLTKGLVFPVARTGAIMSQILSALGEAHDHGIIHRDVKPDNVVLEPRPRGGDVAKLIDFGIAEAKGDGAPAVGGGGIVGTPQYLSPEVIRGEEADLQADLYAAGVVLFELLTGKELFDGKTVHQILEQQLNAERPDPRVVAPKRHIPDAIAELCLRSIARDRAQRFADADEFADALALALSLAPSRPPSGSATPRPSRPGASEVRGITPAGRYSVLPEDRISGERPAPSAGSAFWLLQELEADATTAMAARKWPQAIEKLRSGVRLAGDLVTAGERELGGAALTAFGRKLGEAFRRGGAPQESFDVLIMTLEHAPEPDLPRALLLEELGLSAAVLGRNGDAVGAWLDAAEIARAVGSAGVEKRLLRRIEGDTC